MESQLKLGRERFASSATDLRPHRTSPAQASQPRRDYPSRDALRRSVSGTPVRAVRTPSARRWSFTGNELGSSRPPNGPRVTAWIPPPALFFATLNDYAPAWSYRIPGVPSGAPGAFSIFIRTMSAELFRCYLTRSKPTLRPSVFRAGGCAQPGGANTLNIPSSSRVSCNHCKHTHTHISEY